MFFYIPDLVIKRILMIKNNVIQKNDIADSLYLSFLFDANITIISYISAEQIL